MGILLSIVVFVWLKVEEAKQRERNRRRRRDNNGNANNNNAARLMRNMQSTRDEIRTICAKDRYLNNKSWANQCICMCLDQLIDRDESNNNSVSFKSGIL